MSLFIHRSATFDVRYGIDSIQQEQNSTRRHLTLNMKSTADADSKYKVVPKRGGSFSHWKKRDVHDSRKEVLVVMFGLVGATQRIVAKYCDIYLNRGWHVLYVPGYVRHVLGPRSSIKLCEDLIEYLNQEASEYSHYIIHAISMGGFNYLVFTYEVLPNKFEKYRHFKSKIKAVVYDSVPVGFTSETSNSIVKGGFDVIGSAMFSNLYLQRLFQRLMTGFYSCYMYLMHEYTSARFEYCSQMQQTMPLEVPTLFFYSENDPLSNYEDVRKLITGYRRIGSFPVFDKGWSDSRHAAHLMLHTTDYLDYINRLFMVIPELFDPSTPKSKL